MPHRLHRLAPALALLVVATTACSSSPGDAASGSSSSSTPTSPSPSPTSPGTSPTGSPLAAAPGGVVDKLLVFVVENKSVDQMLSQMPYVSTMSSTYGHADDYAAIQHPSLPNYLAILGGQTFGVNDDEDPSAHTASGPSVFGEAVSAGRTAKLYAEDMKGHCKTTPGPGKYAVKHNPWAYFVDERKVCVKYDVPFDAFNADVTEGALPNLGMVIPNTCNDAHDCPLPTADTWIKKRMERVLKGPDWRSGRLAVVITADEDDSHHGNKILTVVAHPALEGAVATQPLTHYSLSRAYAEVGRVDPIGAAADAPSMLEAFGLRASR